MESKVPFRVKMESLQKTSGGIFSGKFYYGAPGAGVGFGRFPANTSTPQGRGKKHFTATEVNKSVPLQAWSGPEGSRKLRLPYFMTTAQEGGKVVSLTHRPLLPPGNSPGTHFC